MVDRPGRASLNLQEDDIKSDISNEDFQSASEVITFLKSDVKCSGLRGGILLSIASYLKWDAQIIWTTLAAMVIPRKITMQIL